MAHGTMKSNVPMTRPRLNRNNNVESNIEVGSSDESSLKRDPEYSPPASSYNCNAGK